MKIINGQIVPPYRPELIKANAAFLERVRLTGQEARTLVAVCDLLGAILAGHYTVTEVTSQPEKPTYKERAKKPADGKCG